MYLGSCTFNDCICNSSSRHVDHVWLVLFYTGVFGSFRLVGDEGDFSVDSVSAIGNEQVEPRGQVSRA